MEENWIEVGKSDSIDMEDLIRFDHDNRTFCVYRIEDGFYATDGMCTHEDVPVSYTHLTLPTNRGV